MLASFLWGLVALISFLLLVGNVPGVKEKIVAYRRKTQAKTLEAQRRAKENLRSMTPVQRAKYAKKSKILADLVAEIEAEEACSDPRNT